MNFSTILKLALMKKTICSFSIIVLILCFNSPLVKSENLPYSRINIFIENNTLKLYSPVDIWFNDSLVISQVQFGNSIALYKLFSKGNLRITTQIRDFNNTRCEYTLNVLNDQNYDIVIRFENADKPGSIFGFKITDGKNYEPYFEENLFQLINLDEDSIFTDKGLNKKIIPKEYPVCHLILANTTLSFDPIKIWINDQLIINQYFSYSTIHCRFFHEGKIRIEAQLGDRSETKTEMELEISNKQNYFQHIKFQNSNKPAIITFPDQVEGTELLVNYKLSPLLFQRWSTTGIRHPDLFTQVESLDNPVPSMFYPTDYRTSQEIDLDGESISLRDDDYFIDSRDGQRYKTIKIGNQVWMAENLRATRYRNGDIIPCISDFKLWSDDTLGAYCNPNNYSENATKYGRLYNFYSVNNSGGLAPEGWHVATKQDWVNLGSNLSRYKVPGLYMHEIDTIFWSKEMQNKSGDTWTGLKIDILWKGVQEYYSKIDAILSMYQSINNQEIDSVFWDNLRQVRTQTNVQIIQNDMLRLIGEYCKAIGLRKETDLNKKELENALALLELLKSRLNLIYLEKMEMEFLPEVCEEFYNDIDEIEFIYQKKKVTEIYKIKWDGIFGYPMDTLIFPNFTKGISIPNEQKKVEQKSYVISWKDTKQKNDTVYWNYDVLKLDIIAWYYVKHAANSSGFNALPVGYRVSTGEFSSVGTSAYWLATKSDNSNYVGFYNLCDNCFLLGNDMFAFKRKSFGYSIRCVKDK